MMENIIGCDEVMLRQTGFQWNGVCPSICSTVYTNTLFNPPNLCSILICTKLDFHRTYRTLRQLTSGGGGIGLLMLRSEVLMAENITFTTFRYATTWGALGVRISVLAGTRYLFLQGRRHWPWRQRQYVSPKNGSCHLDYSASHLGDSNILVSLDINIWGDDGLGIWSLSEDNKDILNLGGEIYWKTNHMGIRNCGHFKCRCWSFGLLYQSSLVQIVQTKDEKLAW
jgi:hypothetical protein